MLLADESLADQGFQDGAVVTFLRLVEPTKHDGVHDCDICSFPRFCHFGYSYLMDFPDAVMAVCELCGDEASFGEQKELEKEMDELRPAKQWVNQEGWDLDAEAHSSTGRSGNDVNLRPLRSSKVNTPDSHTPLKAPRCIREWLADSIQTDVMSGLAQRLPRFGLGIRQARA